MGAWKPPPPPVISPGEAMMSPPEASVPVTRSFFVISAGVVAERAIEEEGEAVDGRLVELAATRWAGRGGVFVAAPPPPW